jgi:hypothetical protein
MTAAAVERAAALIRPENTPARRRSAARAIWLRGPAHDVALAFLWVPFVVAALGVAHQPERLTWLVSATLLFSFAHQPLTLWLVYGDAAQRQPRRRLVVWAPVVAVLAVTAGTSLRPDVVALVAGLWNVAHTLRQRYGVSRLYGRLAAIDCSNDNKLLWSWLTLAAIAALSGTNLGDSARQAGIGRRNTTAIDALASADALGVVLLWTAGAGAVVVTAAWLRTELRRPAHNPARLVYLGSTALLLGVLAVEPVAGFVGYVGAHAAEYVLVVRWRIRRAGDQQRAGDGVGQVVRRLGVDGSIAMYVVAVAALVAGLRSLGGSQLAVTVTLTLGALHLFYDGLIWRSPRPSKDSRVSPAARHRSVTGATKRRDV